MQIFVFSKYHLIFILVRSGLKITTWLHKVGNTTPLHKRRRKGKATEAHIVEGADRGKRRGA